MLVTDRREDESAFPLGSTRSEAQREPHEKFNQEVPGIFCINATPGPAVLLKLLTQRVWGY